MEALLNRKCRILVVGASIRSSGRFDEQLLSLVNEAASLESLNESLAALPEIKVCNTEIMAAHAMFAAKLEGADVDFVSIRKIFPITDHLLSETSTGEMGLDDDVFHLDTVSVKKNVLDEIISQTSKADAIILSTPIYFGDRSSLANTYLKLCHEKGVLEGKSFSVLSAGAKRNGGQETTNIFALFDAININAVGHGNGPKTSQYGGTSWGGDRKTVLDDDFGIETCMGTGRRAAQVASVLVKGKSSINQNNKRKSLKIKYLITSDTKDFLIENKLKDILAALPRNNDQHDIVNLINYRVERCLACNICPYPPMVEKGSKKGNDYTCIIDNNRDKLEDVREELKDMDALVIVGASTDNPNLIDKYQEFTERTRFIRRGNFEWLNTPFTSLIFKDVDATKERCFGLRVLSSYVRQNCLALKPIRQLEHNGQIISSKNGSASQELSKFIEISNMIYQGRQEYGAIEVSYVAGGSGGYKDTRLDDTTSKRI